MPTLNKSRRTLINITSNKTPLEILVKIQNNFWNYKSSKRKHYQLRDQALIALLYLLALRISEALRLTREQFEIKRYRINVIKIELSKTKRYNKPRVHQYRRIGYIVLHGTRKPFGEIIKRYLHTLEPNEKLFKFGRKRAHQIVNHITGEPPHFFRAYGENYLYDNWKKDLVAVADYIKVDEKTLAYYLLKLQPYTKYQPV